MRRSLTKQQIIRLQADIDNVFKAGKRYSLSCFKLYVAENDLSYSRIIVIPARHYGNSVVRNHIRRQIKEIFRTNMEMISEGRDFAVVIYPAKERNLSYEDREKALIDLLRTSGSLKS
ncbi:MAG: ribonuclease P protein component [Spirochaetales bacterium]|nr:ribonuclease P protein component [Spirochaetales bacterium]